jgi:hypothetical protein
MRASPIVRVRQALLGLYMKRYSAASPPTIEAIERQYQSFLCLPEPESWSIGTPPQFEDWNPYPFLSTDARHESDAWLADLPISY